MVEWKSLPPQVRQTNPLISHRLSGHLGPLGYQRFFHDDDPPTPRGAVSPPSAACRSSSMIWANWRRISRETYPHSPGLSEQASIDCASCSDDSPLSGSSTAFTWPLAQRPSTTRCASSM